MGQLRFVPWCSITLNSKNDMKEILAPFIILATAAAAAFLASFIGNSQITFWTFAAVTLSGTLYVGWLGFRDERL